MKASTTQKRLKQIMSERGLKQVDILDAAKPFCEKYNYKLTKTDLSQYISGKTEPGQYKLYILSLALNVNEAWLMGYDVPITRKNNVETNENEAEIDLSRFPNIKPIKKIKLPVLGEIACGKPIFAEEEHEAFVEVDDSYGADFCLQAKGDSMINAGIDSKDIVLIREAPIVENGEIAAVIIDDEATLKRVYYYKDKNKLVLQAENPKYEPLVYLNEELNSIRILGKAVAVIKRL